MRVNLSSEIAEDLFFVWRGHRKSFEKIWIDICKYFAIFFVVLQLSPFGLSFRKFLRTPLLLGKSGENPVKKIKKSIENFQIN